MLKEENELIQLEKDAESILQDEKKTNELLQKTIKKITGNKEKISEIKDKLQLLVEVMKAYREGSYTIIPKRSILMIVATFIYFVNPFDLLPDFVFGLGFLDDATVIGLTFKQISNDLEKFKLWQKEQTVIE
ncbi:MAG: hypothetical protein K0R71_265 [Bacillales bacterium]|jgi:uncharacterized membrane protein YkvA (DUF1232 family)|nr:hypothetical protein [Bacillales bacterium]